MKVLITTGGTGGHIYPAVALADSLRRHHRDVEISFVGNSDRMETEIIPPLGYRFVGIEAARFNEKNNKIEALKLLYKSYQKCMGLVNELDPDIIVGFGGYVTVPVLMAGVKLRKKTVIHEQNSIAGMANKMLSHFVDRVVTTYKDADAAFPRRKTVNLGNPRESAVLTFDKDRYIISDYGLDPHKKIVLVVMGSLGSQSVNEKMVEVLEKMKDRDYNVIYVTGKNNYAEFREKVTDSENIRIVDYVDQFRLAGNVDLVISRGGATSACEYMALGVPSIIIPSPYVPNNHQYLNAKSMLDSGAARLLEEKDLTSENLLSMVDSLIYDDITLLEMGQKARELAHPNAAEDIIRLMYRLCKQEYVYEE